MKNEYEHSELKKMSRRTSKHCWETSVGVVSTGHIALEEENSSIV